MYVHYDSIAHRVNMGSFRQKDRFSFEINQILTGSKQSSQVVSVTHMPFRSAVLKKLARRQQNAAFNMAQGRLPDIPGQSQKDRLLKNASEWTTYLSTKLKVSRTVSRTVHLACGCRNMSFDSIASKPSKGVVLCSRSFTTASFRAL